jgi:hypothetical protein
MQRSFVGIDQVARPFVGPGAILSYPGHEVGQVSLAAGERQQSGEHDRAAHVGCTPFAGQGEAIRP